jgi:hypothetical protein
MENNKLLKSLDFTKEQKQLICSIINNCGIDHAIIADMQTIDYFTVYYLQEILDSKKFVDVQNNLTETDKALLTEIFKKLCIELIEEMQTTMNSWK